MGRFSTNINVKCADFADKFTEIMKKRGYETCTEDYATLSYVIAQGQFWATLAEKNYNSDIRMTLDDTKFIAKELNTPAFMVEVVDSDFAMIKLNGTEVIVGDGSGYGIENAPKPDRTLWEPLVTNGTFERLTEIWQTHEVFVEDALAKSAPLLGIEPQFIMADYREILDMSDGANITRLYFKKIGAGKPLTLNAAFKQVFGEGLEPLGFKRIKSKYPYFVRVVPGGEIIHVITLLNEPSYIRGKKCFNIFGGIATVYRDEIDLTQDPEVENINWMRSNARIAVLTDTKYDFAYKGGFQEFFFETNNESEMLYELQHSFDVTHKIMLPVISKAVDIYSTIECFSIMGMPLSFNKRFEGMLFLKTPRYADIFINELQKCDNEYKEKMEQQIEGYTLEGYETELRKTKEVLQREVSPIDEVFANPDLLAENMAELERRKTFNTETLRSYGLDI